MTLEVPREDIERVRDVLADAETKLKHDERERAAHQKRAPQRTALIKRVVAAKNQLDRHLKDVW